MDVPLVSIVIPVFNGGELLCEAIDSALAQSCKDYEVVVVDDGSNDGGTTTSVMSAYADRIRSFHQANGGVSSALNRGLREMRGRYFSWLSHDDRYLPNKLQSQLDFAKRHQETDAILYSDHRLIDAAGNFLRDIYIPDYPPELAAYYLYLRHYVHGCSMLIPRDALEEAGGFSEDLRTTQDYDLWVTMAQRRRFIHQSEVLVEARNHPGQGSRQMSDVCRREVREFYLRRLSEVVKVGRPNARQRAERLGQIFGTRLTMRRLSFAKDVWHKAGWGDICSWSFLRATLREVVLTAILAFWMLLPKGVKRRFRRWWSTLEILDSPALFRY